MVPLVFDQSSPGRDIATITDDYSIKHISWMGVVCALDRHGRCVSIWHGPN